MTNYCITFTGNDVSLPDGACVGVIGEHNAVQLVITLPENMIDGITYHIVTVGSVMSARITDEPNGDGAYRVGNTIYFPLSATYTTQRFVDLSVTAYKQLGDAAQVVDKTPTVYGLRFDGGTPLKVPGGLAAEVAALARKVAQIKGLETVQALPETPEADAIVYLNGAGIYHFTGTEWEALTDNGAGFSELEQRINAIRQDLPTAEEIARWNGAVTDSHTHQNAAALDKLIVAEAYADLPVNADDGTVGIVTGIDNTSKTLAEYDEETDADTLLFVADSLTYNQSAVINESTIFFDGSNQEVTLALLPVYTAGTVDPQGGGLGLILETAETNPLAYMECIVNNDPTEEDEQAIIDAFDITAPEGAEVTCLFAYAFEDVSGTLITDGSPISATLILEEGWNAIVVIEGEDLTIAAYPVLDINDFFNIGTFEDFGDNPSSLAFLLDMILLRSVQDKRGLYYRDNNQWVPYYGDRFANIGNRLDVLENGEPDDVTMLGFEMYSDLVVRDEAIPGESITDVPICNQGGPGVICSLYAYTSESQTESGFDDGIELMELRQNDTGMPLLVLNVYVGGTVYSYFSGDYHNNNGTTIVSAGWNLNDQPTDPPTVSFTPDRFRVGISTVYDDLDDLPNDAKSALRSLSQCINASSAAMGTIHVPDDTVLRFAGTFDTNRKYAFKTGDDCAFTLPALPWSAKDAQFVLYLTCTADVDLTLPSGTLISGEINSDTGSHKLIGCYHPNAGAWTVGCVDYEVLT